MGQVLVVVAMAPRVDHRFMGAMAAVALAGRRWVHRTHMAHMVHRMDHRENERIRYSRCSLLVQLLPLFGWFVYNDHSR